MYENYTFNNNILQVSGLNAGIFCHALCMCICLLILNVPKRTTGRKLNYFRIDLWSCLKPD